MVGGLSARYCLRDSDSILDSRFTRTAVNVGVREQGQVQDVRHQETMVRSVGSLPVAQESNPRCSEGAGKDHALQ
jgi:hypothetical protein